MKNKLMELPIGRTSILLKKEFELADEIKGVHSNTWNAYHRLLNALHDKKATKTDLTIAMEEAVGYLGAALDD